VSLRAISKADVVGRSTAGLYFCGGAPDDGERNRLFS
jgi:hypothetical protein